ncbi:conserved hypothetical protein [Desulfurivibrio alkaliphilus AHT 2]|uniref:Type II toxin-antitoxin system HicA family toxin n=1 Tax=Desulfurivibrio alkaliphilus (strain DSM 19089 / UNIQEM U267 / AHT2) TaxID=589865 RepID=D6Z686_DESAT|nr:conserved hypothetical protein [Desulfurivibrio alkaliphilus AHT 2]
MNSRHHHTLASIFAKPTPTGIEWRRIEALFKALGAEVIEGDGSRVAFILKGEKGDFHRPHPAKEAKRYQVRDARDFLTRAGIKP